MDTNLFKEGNFIGDEEKMRDFYFLTKDEFLESYSYLTEEEYDNTKKTISERGRKTTMTLKDFVRSKVNCSYDEAEEFISLLLTHDFTRRK